MPQERKFKPLFGRYVLLRRIGKGGMAEVFRALSFGAKGFRKRVAIKRILPHLCTDEKFGRMFIAEAAIASQLNHSNIVQIHDFGQADGMLYHALDHVHGMSLLDLLKAITQKGAPPPIGPGCYIVKEALYGLEHAHQQCDSFGHSLDIVHRDMTPANLLLSYDGEVKIADFGIAKATPSTVRTAAGVLKGKIRYMSPEQARAHELDQRSDLFSLGVCLYEMCTLRRLYTGKTQFELITKASEGKFTPPREHNPDIPVELEAIILKALASDREQRFHEAAAFRDALEHFMSSTGLGFFRSNMTRFMEANFASRIEGDQREMIEEAHLATRLQPKEGWDGGQQAPLELAQDLELDIEVDSSSWPMRREPPQPPIGNPLEADSEIQQGEEESLDDQPTSTMDAEDLEERIREASGPKPLPKRTLRAIPAVQFVVPQARPEIIDDPDEEELLDDEDSTRPAMAAPEADLSKVRTRRAMPVVRDHTGQGYSLDQDAFNDETVPSATFDVERDED